MLNLDKKKVEILNSIIKYFSNSPKTKTHFNVSEIWEKLRLEFNGVTTSDVHEYFQILSGLGVGEFKDDFFTVNRISLLELINDGGVEGYLRALNSDGNENAFSGFDLPSEVSKLIAKDEVKKALDLLLVRAKGSPFFEEIIILSNRFEDLNKKIRIGTIDESARVIEKNKIINSILYLAPNLKKEPSSNFTNTTGNKNKSTRTTFFYVKSIFGIGILSALSILIFNLIPEQSNQFSEGAIDQEKVNGKPKEDSNVLLPISYEKIISDNVALMPPNSYQYENSQVVLGTIEGDFDGDNTLEKAILINDRPKVNYSEEDYGPDLGNYIIQFTSTKYGIMKIESNFFSIKIKNEGDLNDAPGDEIAIYYFGQGAWGSIEIMSFSPQKLWEQVVFFRTWYGDVDQPKRIIKKEKGYFTIVEDIWNEKSGTSRIERIITN